MQRASSRYTLPEPQPKSNSVKAVSAPAKPKLLHTTCASFKVQDPAQTVPQVDLEKNSTLPSLLFLPPTRRTRMRTRNRFSLFVMVQWLSKWNCFWYLNPHFLLYRPFNFKAHKEHEMNMKIHIKRALILMTINKKEKKIVIRKSWERRPHHINYSHLYRTSSIYCE